MDVQPTGEGARQRPLAQILDNAIGHRTLVTGMLLLGPCDRVGAELVGCDRKLDQLMVETLQRMSFLADDKSWPRPSAS